MAASSGAYNTWSREKLGRLYFVPFYCCTLCEVRSTMIALLMALLSMMSGGSHAAAFVNQAAPAAAHSQAVKRILPATGHPLAG
jgi:hypothetical protein